MTAPAQNNTDAATTPEGQETPAQEPAANQDQGSLLDGDGSNTSTDESGSLLDDNGDGENSEGEAPEQKAPETYEDFKMPEGFSLGEEILGKFTEQAKAANLTQEQAQSMLNLASDNVQAMVNAERAKFVETRNTWEESIKNDTEFGGPKFKETITRAQRTLSKHGDDDLKKFLSDSSFGSNPGLIKLLARVDKVLGEDQTPGGEKPGGSINSPDTLAGALFPNG